METPEDPKRSMTKEETDKKHDHLKGVKSMGIPLDEAYPFLDASDDGMGTGYTVSEGIDKDFVDFTSNILSSRFVCPIGNSISECDPSKCAHYEVCEGWKEIMFKVVEETTGSLIRGLFLR